MKDNFYWYELYATDETDKKIFINGITSNLSEGGPIDYAQVPAFTRLVNSNTKFEIKPYSVNFIANSNSTVDIGDYDSIVMNFNNPFKDFLTFSEIKNFKKITILNVNGIPILESYSRTIDTSKISPGIYFYFIRK